MCAMWYGFRDFLRNQGYPVTGQMEVSKEMEATHASCLGHFHAYQTTIAVNTRYTIAQNVS